MGVVYKAEHVHLESLVALKLLPVENAREPELLARFLNEMKAIGRLRHPNLVSATDAGEANGQYYLAMELLDGFNLANLSRYCGQLAVAEACELIRQAAIGLHFMHESGLYHRDVKPSNLFLTMDGVTKVLDLGLAHLRQGTGSEHTWTRPGTMLGTGDFMAPEQGQNAHGVDRRADVYSLGCSLYKLLSGKAPFENDAYDTLLKKVIAHGHTPVPPIGERRTDIPPELVSVLDRMLAKAPEDRLPDCAAVAEAMTVFATGADLKALLAQASAKAAAEPPDPRLAPVPTVQEDTKEYTREPTDSVTAESAMTTLIRPSRRWWVAAPVVVIAVAFALWAGWSALVPLRDPRPAAGSPKLLDGEWVALLRHSPTKIVWRHGSSEPTLQHDKDKERIFISTSEMVMLQLAEVPVGSYQVFLKIRQPTWTGNWAVFYGRREESHGNTRETRYNSVELAPYMKKGIHPFAFHHSRVRVVDEGFHPASLSSHPIVRPANFEYTLELKVLSRRLTEVKWNGEYLKNLTLETDAGQPDEKGLDGFGIIVNQGSATFEKCEIKLLEGNTQ